MRDQPEAASIIRKFFNGDSVVDILKITLEKYLRMTPTALETWESDPEEYLIDEYSDLYQVRLEAASELFFWWFVRVNNTHGAKIGKLIQSLIVSEYTLIF